MKRESAIKKDVIRIINPQNLTILAMLGCNCLHQNSKELIDLRFLRIDRSIFELRTNLVDCLSIISHHSTLEACKGIRNYSLMRLAVFFFPAAEFIVSLRTFFSGYKSDKVLDEFMKLSDDLRAFDTFLLGRRLCISLARRDKRV